MNDQHLNKKRSKPKGRHEARIFSFQFLYHLQFPDFTEKKQVLCKTLSLGNEDALENELALFCQSNPMTLDLEAKYFAINLIKGSLTHYPEIEKIIEKYSTNWSLQKISKIELTILLQAIFELMYVESTPKKVVINESIEIAKKFSEKTSSSFINGILDKVAQNI